ncbi:MAG: hypothetical protein ACE5FB_00445 [Candidatus Binatia bacterium]
MRRFIEVICACCVATIVSGCISTAAINGGIASSASREVPLLNCAHNKEREPCSDIRQNAYEEGFRAGMKSLATEFRTKEEMNQPYVWRPPLVSEVDMPPRVVNGVMIPAHTEPVIVSPGFWIRTENVVQDR